MISFVKKNWAITIAVIVLAAIIFYRALILPFTHDESATWLYLRHTNVWGCFFDPECWNWGNNHWLNTILLQFFANIGGEIPVVLRIPNILGGWAYLIAAALLVTRYLNNGWSQFCGFLFISFHIYLLDFFSLARGYGMMTSGIIWAIYSLLRYAEKFELKWLIILIVSLFLAILSNFTGVIPFASIIGALFLCIVVSKRYDLLKTHGLIIFFFVLGTYLLIRIPLSTLAEKGELQWGASGVKAMIIDLFTSLWANFYYLDLRNPMMFFWFVFVLLSIGLVALLFRPKIKAHIPLALLYVSLAGILVMIVFMQLFTKAQAPIGRKSIFLIPFIFCTLALCQRLITKTSIAKAVGITGSILILIHFYSVVRPNLKSTREWYFDANYPQLFEAIVPNGSESDSVRLGTSWIFVPSLTFYQQTKSLPISGLAYQKKLEIDTTMDYYYVDPSDSTGFYLTPFVFDKKIGMFALFKKRSQ